jgi:urocanate hydratase
LSEKAVLVRLNLALGLRRIIHHEQTPRHDKCLNYVAEAQTAATERRLRKEQEARERAEWERAMAREWSLYKSQSKQHHSHHHSSSSSTRKHLQQESHRNLVQGTA